MVVKDGYKKTEMGVIPDDWEVKKLGEILQSTQLGGNYPNTELETNSPLIKMGNLVRGYIDLSKLEYIMNTHKPYNRDKLCYGDVIFNTRNTLDLVGKVAIWRNELPFAFFNSNIMRLKFKEKYVASNFYMNYIFNTKKILSQLRNIATGTTSVAAIYTRDLLTIQISLPPLPEQNAIAEVLSDTDNLIQLLEKRIAKKRLIKQGAMQKLLTGRKRVEVVYEDWHEIELRCIVDQFIVPMRDKPKQFSGNIPWCRIEDFNGKYLYDSKSKQYVNEKTISQMNLKVFPKETLIVSCSADLGKCAILKRPLVTNQTFIGLVINEQKASNEFLYYFMGFNSKKLNQLSSGTTISYLSREQFESLKVKVPKTKQEQTRIATILSDMDEEIEKLETKLAKYKQLKQGLMQNLLTGKIRLV